MSGTFTPVTVCGRNYATVRPKTDTRTRRAAIIGALRIAGGPVKGDTLALVMDVSRQTLANDIAVLRASGHQIHGTTDGYILVEHQEREAT